MNEITPLTETEIAELTTAVDAMRDARDTAGRAEAALVVARALADEAGTAAGLVGRRVLERRNVDPEAFDIDIYRTPWAIVAREVPAPAEAPSAETDPHPAEAGTAASA